MMTERIELKLIEIELWSKEPPARLSFCCTSLSRYQVFQ